jgi:hypothetical protein
LSDLITRIAKAKKELIALKAGFGGDQQRFLPTVATQATFNITSSKALIIRATFAHDDFPQLYAAVSFTIGAAPPVILQYKAFIRKSYYEWRYCEEWIGTPNYTIVCTLVSQRAPTSFVILEE